MCREEGRLARNLGTEMNNGDFFGFYFCLIDSRSQQTRNVKRHEKSKIKISSPVKICSI